MEFKDYYATLGLSKTSTDKEIKQAYRKLARKHHPDVNPGDKSAEAKFKEINEAYEVLGDPDKRKKYDELGANWRMYEQAQQQGGAPFGGFGGAGGYGGEGGAWTINMGGPGGYRTMSEDEMRDMFGTENPFSDFFNAFFGGGGAAAGESRARGRTPRTERGRDVEHEIDLTLEEAFHGATRRISIKQAGHARTVDVRIPAGVKDGSRVRVHGEGEAGSNGGTAGDLFLRVRVKPHAIFERQGDDLYTKVALPLTTAVLGGEAQIPTISGPVRLKVPETTQPGQVFRLKGHGMPRIGKTDTRGDLYATADVQLPRTLNKDQRTYFEALKKLESR
ncbi:MAG TPA: DnaJ C-terminal domain-containing protein [Vicinamibacterales bacterium]|jgi:curved DNA-binding protein|nr:DnaJ C-terminal domain-containing protein [Vicinamibacterales bacterium]